MTLAWSQIENVFWIVVASVVGGGYLVMIIAACIRGPLPDDWRQRLWKSRNRP